LDSLAKGINNIARMFVLVLIAGIRIRYLSTELYQYL